MSSLEVFQDKEFNDFLKKKGNGLILFSAPWCAACKIVTPIIENIKKQHDKTSFIKIDVSKNPGLASRMGVMSLPNILFISSGKVVDQSIGTTTQKEIETKLKKIA